ncbi:aminotransferase class IV [Arenivirga flava]|uniref:Aminotransferase class IV n=1 Tax=Arenivirga flava TaxID=1930060 RepID=A0AA37UF38_9MICO|nr:aminotransferase class IV [Arenivirga flava]GMA27923.1 hypothetical protein GCM10025874_11760 [Arenivirga flava]
MPAEPAVLRWTGRALEPVDEAVAGPVLAADSWLVDDGLVLALDAHRARFLGAVGGRADAAPFWAAAVATLPREGAWFPRVELLRLSDGSEELRLQLRPAPARGRELVVATHWGPDPRSQPTVKGPDLEALGAARARTAERGADEAVLLSPDGELVEGAWSALAWWHSERMHVVDPALPRIRSVTEHELLAVAAEEGVGIDFVRATPTELDGAELWVLSALHGPRRATAWLDGPRLTGRPGRLDHWRGRLLARRQPLA